MRSHPTTAALALALLAAPAFSQDGLVWIDATTGASGGLVYGLPESDYVVLSLRCDPVNYELVIAFTPDNDLPPATSAVTLTLTSDGGKVVLPAARVFSEMLGADFIEATVVQLDEALAAILTTGTELAVNGDGVTTRLPVPDEAVRAPFIDACIVLG